MRTRGEITMYKGGEPLKRYQVYLDSVYQDSFEEDWQAMQYIDENIVRYQNIANEENEVINVRIYDEYNFADLENETIVLIPTKESK